MVPRTLRRPPPPLVAEAAAERLRVREEIASLRAEVVRLQTAADDQRTLRAAASHMRRKAEASVRRWRGISLALAVLAIIGWIF